MAAGYPSGWPSIRPRALGLSGLGLALAHALGHPRLERPDLDEARRRLLGEQPAGLGERRELGVVDRVPALACDDADVALEQLEPDRARHARVDVLEVGLDVGAQRLPPQPGVDEVGPLAIELGLELVLVDGADQTLELTV